MNNHIHDSVIDAQTYIGRVDIRRYINKRKYSQRTLHNNGSSKLFQLLCKFLATGVFSNNKTVNPNELPYFLDILYLVDITDSNNSSGDLAKLYNITREYLSAGNSVPNLIEQYSASDTVTKSPTKVLSAPIFIKEKRSLNISYDNNTVPVTNMQALVPFSSLNKVDVPTTTQGWCNYYCLTDFDNNILAYVVDTEDSTESTSIKSSVPFTMNENETFIITWNMAFVNPAISSASTQPDQ